MHTELLQLIKERRSVREFTSDPVSKIDVMAIVEAGIWAPSAKNNQPWKFVIVNDSSLSSLISEFSVYSSIIAQSKALICVFLDSDVTSSDNLDLYSTGALLQNMVLATESLGLGSVWLGELQECRERIQSELGITDKYELAAILAIGYPAHRNQKSHRKNVSDFILKHIGG